MTAAGYSSARDGAEAARKRSSARESSRPSPRLARTATSPRTPSITPPRSSRASTRGAIAELESMLARADMIDVSQAARRDHHLRRHGQARRRGYRRGEDLPDRRRRRSRTCGRARSRSPRRSPARSSARRSATRWRSRRPAAARATRFWTSASSADRLSRPPRSAEGAARGCGTQMLPRPSRMTAASRDSRIKSASSREGRGPRFVVPQRDCRQLASESGDFAAGCHARMTWHARAAATAAAPYRSERARSKWRSRARRPRRRPVG